jgi:hypothetical protein
MTSTFLKPGKNSTTKWSETEEDLDENGKEEGCGDPV